MSDEITAIPTKRTVSEGSTGQNSKRFKTRDGLPSRSRPTLATAGVELSPAARRQIIINGLNNGLALSSGRPPSSSVPTLTPLTPIPVAQDVDESTASEREVSSVLETPSKAISTARDALTAMKGMLGKADKTRAERHLSKAIEVLVSCRDGHFSSCRDGHTDKGKEGNAMSLMNGADGSQEIPVKEAQRSVIVVDKMQESTGPQLSAERSTLNEAQTMPRQESNRIQEEQAKAIQEKDIQIGVLRKEFRRVTYEVVVLARKNNDLDEQSIALNQRVRQAETKAECERVDSGKKIGVLERERDQTTKQAQELKDNVELARLAAEAAKSDSDLVISRLQEGKARADDQVIRFQQGLSDVQVSLNVARDKQAQELKQHVETARLAAKAAKSASDLVIIGLQEEIARANDQVNRLQRMAEDVPVSLNKATYKSASLNSRCRALELKDARLTHELASDGNPALVTTSSNSERKRVSQQEPNGDTISSLRKKIKNQALAINELMAKCEKLKEAAKHDEAGGMQKAEATRETGEQHSDSAPSINARSSQPANESNGTIITSNVAVNVPIVRKNPAGPPAPPGMGKKGRKKAAKLARERAQQALYTSQKLREEERLREADEKLRAGQATDPIKGRSNISQSGESEQMGNEKVERGKAASDATSTYPLATTDLRPSGIAFDVMWSRRHRSW